MNLNISSTLNPFFKIIFYAIQRDNKYLNTNML